jgi:TolB protein
MNPDGTGQRRLTNTPTWERSPKWSPDGTKILYTNTSPLGNSATDGIYTMNPDGTGVTQLTHSSSEGHPNWAPDGSKIVVCDRFSIKVMNADGSGQRQLTPGPDDCTAGGPAWSPSGRKIAFSREAPSGDPEFNPLTVDQIFLMDPDGSGIKNISNNGYLDGDPIWSPSGGSKLLFYRQGDVYVMNSSGRGASVRAPSPDWDRPDSWSPDGTKVLFESTRGGACSICSGIFVMNRDGTGIMRLTGGTTNDQGRAILPGLADWQPLPRGGPH